VALTAPGPGLRLSDPFGPPELDADGRVRSVQVAELDAPPPGSDAFCSRAGLERLSDAYWRFITRISLGLIRVRRRPDGCQIVLVGRPLVLLAFAAPRLEHHAHAGSISWPIAGGLLLSRRHHGKRGLLRISVNCPAPHGSENDRLRVEVAVLDFPPAIASRFGARVYSVTQSRIHLLVTRGFLRSVYRATRRATSGASAGPS
jgi:hypothetical protein